jgi:hypothetical protein
MSSFLKYDLTKEQQKKQQDLVNEELIRRRKVIPSFNEVTGLKEMWIVVQQNKGNL